MTCMTVFAEAMAMPTMQLTRAIQYEDAGFRQLEGSAERKSPRMSWVVVTGNDGGRQLRIQWEARGRLTLDSDRTCNVLLTD